MSNCTKISIARDFSKTPSGRGSSDGEFSAEAFRERILWPALLAAESVEIDVSGTDGMSSSFLEEVFAGLFRAHPLEAVTLSQKITVLPAKSSYAIEVLEYLEAGRRLASVRIAGCGKPIEIDVVTMGTSDGTFPPVYVFGDCAIFSKSLEAARMSRGEPAETMESFVDQGLAIRFDNVTSLSHWIAQNDAAIRDETHLFADL